MVNLCSHNCFLAGFLVTVLRTLTTLPPQEGNTPLDIARNDEVKAVFEEHSAKGGQAEQPFE